MAITSDSKVDIEKNSALHVDDIASEKDLKAAEADPNADYTGAAAKTDPAEIALVRKLDFRIMPALFCMYFLYVPIGSTVPTTKHVSNSCVSGTNSTRTPSPTRD